MKVSQLLKVVLYALGRLLMLLSDAVGDFFGRSLSFRAQTFLRPDTLSDFLYKRRLDPGQMPVSVEGVELLAIESVSSNCNNTVVRLEMIPSGVLPDSLFVKLPSPSFITRWFFSIILEKSVGRSSADTIPA